MPVPPLPPLRVRESDGSPNVIPVFEIICSDGTVTNLGGGKIRLATGSGAQGPAGSGMGIGSSVVLGSPGAILFVSTSSLLQQEPWNLFYDEAADRVGIGTSIPGTVLDVVGSGRIQGQLILTLDAASAGHAVRGNRTISTTAPVAGGGNLTADRTITVDTAFLVGSTRAINTTEPLRGGGNLSADRTLTIAAAGVNSAGALSSADWVTFNAKQPTITWPLITGSGGTGIDFVGSGGMVLGVSTGGTTLEYKVLAAGNNVTITHAGSTMTFASLQTTTGNVYAATGNSYVVLGSAADLTAERIFVPGLGIVASDSGANAGYYVEVNTPFLVSSNRTLNTTAPVAGGGNLGADRTITVDTAFLVGSTRAINTTEPLRGGGNLSADRTFTIAAAGVNSAGALSSADWVTFNNKQTLITWPLGTGSGGTGIDFVGSGGMVLGVSTGGSTLEYKVLTAGANITITHAGSTMTFAATTGAAAAGAATTAETYIVIANTNSLSAERALAVGTGLTLTDAGANSTVTLAISNRIVEIPLAPLMVNTGNANVFWTSLPRTSFYDGAWAFSDNTVGQMWWTGYVPARLWGTPAWTLVHYSEAGAGAGGNAILTFTAKDYSHGDNFATALTALSSTGTHAILATGSLTVLTASGGNFDAVEALSGGTRLVVMVERSGNAVADTVGQQWNLLGMSLRVAVP